MAQAFFQKSCPSVGIGVFTERQRGVPDSWANKFGTGRAVGVFQHIEHLGSKQFGHSACLGIRSCDRISVPINPVPPETRNLAYACSQGEL